MITSSQAVPLIGEPLNGDAWPTDAVEVGKVVDAWGVKGWVKVLPHAKDPQALFSSKRWLYRPGERLGVTSPTAGQRLRVLQAKEHGDVVVAQIENISDRDSALALKGGEIHVPRSSFPTAPEGEYYWVDLLGSEVINRAGESLGQLVDLIDTGAHAVMRVESAVDAAAGKPLERLIPFVAVYVDDVNIQARCIMVDWGLDY